MIHAFDTEYAQQYGLIEAVLIVNFQNWIKLNQANRRHQHEGRTWTYNSNKALSEVFSYLTDKQVRRAVDHLVETGVLLKGNFNQSAYDRTCWYAFVDESIYLKGQIDLPKKANGNASQGEPIPSTNQIQKPSTSTAADAEPIRARKSPITMKTWLANCEQNQEEPISEDDPIFADSDKTRLPVEFILLTWLEFRDRYKTGDKSNERYADWRATFRNCVRGNWYKLWALDANGEYFLTTNGKMAMRRHEKEMAA